MKSTLLLLGVLALAGGVYADDTPTPSITPTNTINKSETPTPTITPTNTFNLSNTLTFTTSASPSITPSSTITPSFTLTPTRTQVPSRINNRYKRIYIEPRGLHLSDSISKPGLTPVAGTLYLAKDQGLASAVFAVPTPATPPQARIRWTVPQDFQGWPFPLRLWARGVVGTVGADNTVTVNVYRMWNNSSSTVLTSTAQNNYMHIQTMSGVDTNIQTQFTQYSLSSLTVTSKRILLPVPAAVSQCAAGDELEFEIIRTAGTGTLKVFGIEIEYDKKEALNP